MSLLLSATQDSDTAMAGLYPRFLAWAHGDGMMPTAGIPSHCGRFTMARGIVSAPKNTNAHRRALNFNVCFASQLYILVPIPSRKARNKHPHVVDIWWCRVLLFVVLLIVEFEGERVYWYLQDPPSHTDMS